MEEQKQTDDYNELDEEQKQFFLELWQNFNTDGSTGTETGDTETGATLEESIVEESLIQNE